MAAVSLDNSPLFLYFRSAETDLRIKYSAKIANIAYAHITRLDAVSNNLAH